MFDVRQIHSKQGTSEANTTRVGLPDGVVPLMLEVVYTTTADVGNRRLAVEFLTSFMSWSWLSPATQAASLTVTYRFNIMFNTSGTSIASSQLATVLPMMKLTTIDSEDPQSPVVDIYDDADIEATDTFVWKLTYAN